jgi:hypothetical protein
MKLNEADKGFLIFVFTLISIFCFLMIIETFVFPTYPAYCYEEVQNHIPSELQNFLYSLHDKKVEVYTGRNVYKGKIKRFFDNGDFILDIGNNKVLIVYSNVTLILIKN